MSYRPRTTHVLYHLHNRNFDCDAAIRFEYSTGYADQCTQCADEIFQLLSPVAIWALLPERDSPATYAY